MGHHHRAPLDWGNRSARHPRFPVLYSVFRVPCFLLACAFLAVPSTTEARPPPLVFAVVVGNNDGLGMLPQLNFADDDALRFYQLAVRLAPKQNVALLAELDVDTWRRIQVAGAHPPPFLPPTRKRLLEVIRLYKAQIARARRLQPGRPVHFYFFFSGHGERGYFFLKKKAGPLAEAAFTGTDLQRTFADSRATLNWLFIDACKSQSLFVAKGPQEGEDDELGPDFSGLINKLDRTVARSRVGVLTSTVSDKPAGEARDIRGGYFSHVLTSGLRGAADANSDGVVRYGELASFVSFHTRRIAGQRPWFRPPRGRLDEALIVLSGRKDLVEILPGVGGHFVVFDERGGNLLLELHKTEAQHSRLILAPGKYKVVWVKGRDRGLLARVTLGRGGGRKLMLKDFSSPVTLGKDRVPKGEGLGAPISHEQTLDLAISDYDPGSSGFDQPFTPRVVSALATAYNSGLSATVSTPAAVTRQRPEHLLSVGYGYLPPPADPFTAGHGVTLSYGHRLRVPVILGGRVLYGISDHESPTTGDPFQMHRLALQAEAAWALQLGNRLELTLGGYVGWQMVLVTMKVKSLEDDITGGQSERWSTRINGDAGGFRLGAMAGLRLKLVAGLWASAVVAGGLELIHQEDQDQREEALLFFRPQILAQVGYAF